MAMAENDSDSLVVPEGSAQARMRFVQVPVGRTL